MDEELLKLVAMGAHPDIAKAFVSRIGPGVVVVTITTRYGKRLPDYVVALAQEALDRHRPVTHELIARSLELRLADVVS